MRERFFEPGPLRVKICGLTREPDARRSGELGADALGFNFWPQSKRYLDPVEAVPWIRALPGDAARVAVVVNPEPELLAGLLAAGCFEAIQFHGNESPEFCRRHGGPRWIKALAVRPENRGQPGAFPTADVLLDAPSAGFGGSGEAADWSLAAEWVKSHPEKRFILAGGLTAANVFEAAGTVRPHAVDVASGVESGPGIKDLDRVRDFIAQARAA
ncbi:MAG TPA: phosphoribosylanthranilate isomerase [Chthoniobacterales bacterium]